MSKSLGNVVTLSDILARGYDAADLRFYLLSVHYRTNLKFSWKGMDDARDARRKIADAFSHVDARVHGEGVHATTDVVANDVRRHSAEFRAALDSDLNAPAALATMFAVTKIVNTLEATGETAYSDADIGALREFVDLARATFGCFEPSAAVHIPADVQVLLDQRAAARTAKDFAESDRLRVEIEKRGFLLKDTPKGQHLEARRDNGAM